jgi:hypothetical protein
MYSNPCVYRMYAIRFTITLYVQVELSAMKFFMLYDQVSLAVVFVLFLVVSSFDLFSPRTVLTASV